MKPEMISERPLTTAVVTLSELRSILPLLPDPDSWDGPCTRTFTIEPPDDDPTWQRSVTFCLNSVAIRGEIRYKRWAVHKDVVVLLDGVTTEEMVARAVFGEGGDQWEAERELRYSEVIDSRARLRRALEEWSTA